MSGYSTESLRDAIRRAKDNIKSLEAAIEKERATIREYQGYIRFNEDKDREIVIEVEE